eukprot:m.19425 g.19425  ORF g.19425 m.19425 type:complete len:148 (+) comp10902_c0_seq1:148-591(+)
MVTAIFARAASSILGTLWPAYRSYKAIKGKDVLEYKRWMQYWTCFGIFLVVEMFADFLIWWFPFYYELKFLVLLFLLLPYFNGPATIFKRVVKPTLDKHEEDIDEVLDQLDKHGYAWFTKVLDWLRRNVLGMLVNASAAPEEDEKDQ